MGLGLLCDEDGPPVSIAVVPGNPPAPHPLAAQLEKGKTRLGVTASPFVGDRGMIKGPQGEDRATPGCHYMTAITNPQIDTLRHTGGLQMALCDQELAEGLAEEGIR